jgi:hypothetical protein
MPAAFQIRLPCWRRLAEWHEAGVWGWLHQVLLAELRAAGKLDWLRGARSVFGQTPVLDR